MITYIYEGIETERRKYFDEKPVGLLDIACISIGNELIFSRFVNTAKMKGFFSMKGNGENYQPCFYTYLYKLYFLDL
jgi:hypothetical protein